MMLLVPVWGAAWWVAGVPVLAARLRVDRALLGPRATDQLRERVEEVTTSRAETVDHSTAELRRMERDLHDGRRAGSRWRGMTHGLAQKARPDRTRTRRRGARGGQGDRPSTTLEDLRTLVRGIDPPVLADRGLVRRRRGAGGALPVPVTVAADLTPSTPGPVEAAAPSPSPSASRTSRSTRACVASLGRRRSRRRYAAPDGWATMGAVALMPMEAGLAGVVGGEQL